MTNTLVHPWMIDPRDGLPLRALGVRKNGRAIFPIMGASEDEDDEGDEVTGDGGAGGDEDEDDEGDEDPWAGKSEAELKTELAKLKAAGDRTRREAEAWRKKATGKTTPPKPAPPKPTGKGDTFTKEELDAQREEAQEAARAGLMPTLIRTAAEAKLERAGLTLPEDPGERAAKLRRVMKLVDTEAVDVDDQGDLLGLDDAVDALKADYPELFKGKARAPRPGNVSGGKGSNGKPKTATELQMEHAFGRS